MTRFRRFASSLPLGRYVTIRPFSAVRETLAHGYSLAHFRGDLMAGLVVGVVALPLSMALAIASGVPPQHGLYTAIVAGGLIAVLGGSRVQVSGPTAAFVVLLAPISARYGLQGLAMASAMAGVLLFAMGALRLGRLIEFIPYPVTTGFTAGIATVIATLQLKDFLGLELAAMPESYVEKVHALFTSLATTGITWHDAVVGVATLALLLLWPRITRRIPAALVALTAVALAAAVLHYFLPDFDVATIRSRFGTEAYPHGIPQSPPIPGWPWSLPGPNGGAPVPVTWEMIQALFPSALAIAMLGAIESLLSAVVSDGMAGFKHDPDAELLAQGTGNMLAPFFGGFAATGAIARTATNVRAGGRSPLAAVVHAIFVLVAVLALAPLLGYLPMAAMAALLLIVAWNMSEVKHFFHTVRVAPYSDVVVLLVCFLLTVIFDMTIAVGVGVVLAAMLFMQRMAAFSTARLVGEHHPELDEPLPPGLVVYEVAGPLFFGAAQKAMSELRTIGGDVRVVLIDLSAVPIMDATGLVNLEGAVDKLYRGGIHVILAGVQPQPRSVLSRAHWHDREGRIELVESLPQGLATGRALVQLLAD